ncbi:MAG: HlyD family efflux transporter periplasmic adaptor subunit [Clostridiales bacterium]|nr:HlyD family efflux transporter periplasmic adaptor subunit [Clostridiales bacterium]
MKRIASILTLLTLLWSLPALAAEQDLTDRAVADGVVAAAQFADITAPFSGTLASFDLEPGDTVQAGDVLMRYVTTEVYATEPGVVKAVYAAAGQDAAAVTARYGGVVGVEPTAAYRVEATTSGADKDNENKILHLGEMLYFKTSGNSPTKGTGRVVGVSGDAYTVEVITGEFDLKDSVTLYRKDNYASKSCVGKGKIVRRDALLVTATGRLTQVYVGEGDRVFTGDPLFSLVAADATPEACATDITAAAAGVVESVSVAPGQQVYRGQALCRVGLTGRLEVRADVDEVDLGHLAVGDQVPVTLDMRPDQVLMATVTRISQLGESRQNAAYFTVRADIPAGTAPLGASASLYLSKK